MQCVFSSKVEHVSPYLVDCTNVCSCTVGLARQCTITSADFCMGGDWLFASNGPAAAKLGMHWYVEIELNDQHLRAYGKYNCL